MNWRSPPPGFRFILFERTNQAENELRFYYLGWQATLFDAGAVVRLYGRKGETQHLITPQPFSSLEEAWPLLRTIISKRLQHGYRIVLPDVYQGQEAG